MKKNGVQFCLKWNISMKHKYKKATHDQTVPFPRPLNFKLQQVLKFNNICVSWSLSNADLEMHFENLENRRFETLVFLSRNYLSRYFTFLHFY